MIKANNYFDESCIFVAKPDGSIDESINGAIFGSSFGNAR